MIPLSLLAQAAPGVTLTPGLLALLGLLVAALSALVAGGIAWGRFDAALAQLRSDHADLRADVKKGASDGQQLAVLTQSVAEIKARVEVLGNRSHEQASAIVKVGTLLDTLSSRVGTLADDVRHSSHPSPR